MTQYSEQKNDTLLSQRDSYQQVYRSQYRRKKTKLSLVNLHHLTHAQSDKLEALQKRAVRIILYPLTLPYITALGYLKLESLTHRRTEPNNKYFNSISQPDNCLHHLLPPPRDTQLITTAVRKQVSSIIHKNKTVLFFYQFCPCKLCRMIVRVFLYIVHVRPEFSRIFVFLAVL